MNKRPTVFFDRDGTLNIESGYIHDLNNLILENGAGKSVKKLNDLGVLCILVTNQSGPARGYYEEKHVLDLNNKLVELLKKDNAYLDAIYYCPHLSDGIVEEYTMDCNCRKPMTGMINNAIQDFSEIDLHKSYVVGDKASDVELAYNAKCKGILLKTGYGDRVLEGTYQSLDYKPHYIADNIVDAVNWIINDLGFTK